MPTIACLVAASFAVSWIADTVSGRAAGVWYLSYLYPVGQFGLLYPAIAPRRWYVPLLLGTALVAALSILQGPLDRPELVLHIGGAAVVTWLAFRLEPGLLRWGLLIYYGCGAVFRLWFPLAYDAPGFFFACWSGFQVCRIGGLLLVALAFVRGPRLAIMR